MSDAVTVSDLVVRYGRVTALNGAQLCRRRRGSAGHRRSERFGKSTLLKTIAGLLQPTSGDVCVFGRKPQALAPGSIAYVPQIEDVDWSFPATVYDVVAMGRFPRLGMFKRFGRADREAVLRALDLLKMSAFSKRHISALSGGQQQRVFVARAIAQDPKLLLLDEPATGVDAATEESLQRVIRELVGNGLPVIMTTHDLDTADAWFDRLLVLDRKVLAIGRPQRSARFGRLCGNPRAYAYARAYAGGCMNHLLEPFQFGFMQRAFVTALLVGVLCPTMGTYVVLRKLSFIGDGIAHASFAGIVIAYLRGVDYYLGAGVVAVITALGIGFVHRRGRIALDTAIGVLFTGAFALGIFLMSRQRTYAIDLQSFSVR